MRKTLTLEIPTSWKDVTLKQYLALQADMEAYRDDEEAQTALMLYHLCGLDAEYIKQLSAESYNNIRSKLNEFISPESIELQQFVTIGGVEYGFEPNLSKMSYGAYADITKHDTIAVDKNWSKVMSILYRPVEKKQFGKYSIKPYDGEIDETKWLDVNMEVQWGALFFFVRLQMDLLKGILKSLKEEEVPASMRSILARSGELMQQSLSWPMANLKK
uniref:Uncharacterized protein n=1 Tax=uncultured Caudovirales phage TaxID=2100421 RepID=A0A6J7WZQ8_9CAUD|nr:hypothetical protein UFOVP385_25 [uncultured Caudovirales phage]